MRPNPLNLFSALSILLLIAFSRAGAQTPQRDNRPRTASISGRVTVAGKPAVNAAITVVETDVNPDGVLAAGGSDNRIPFSAKARTDGDGRYLVAGLAEGHYFVGAALKAFIDADRSVEPGLRRTVNLDEGEAREKVDFALIRGGVLTGKVTDDEDRPLVAKRVQPYTVDDQGRKSFFHGHGHGTSFYEMAETDDRGVYRIYGLPPGRYIICAGGEGGADPLRARGGKFARTYHPDTTDENQARIIEIKEESEVADVDIRFGGARKTYQAAGRVLERESGKPVPRVQLSCRAKSETNRSDSNYSTTVTADEQGHFRMFGLTSGRYQIRVVDVLSETGYRGDVEEFEIKNDNVRDIEVKAFLGAVISGVVVIDGGDAGAKKQLQGMVVYPSVRPPNNTTDAANLPGYAPSAIVNSDGGFTIKGLQAGSVSFRLISSGEFRVTRAARIKRIERDGIEIKDPIELRPGEKIAGVRIVVFQASGRIRGQVQVIGDALPEGWRLYALVKRMVDADESSSVSRGLVTIVRDGGSTIVDEKGRFALDELVAGEFDLSVTPIKRTAEGDWATVDSLVTNQRIIVRENGETSVTLTLDLNRKDQPKD